MQQKITQKIQSKRKNCYRFDRKTNIKISMKNKNNKQTKTDKTKQASTEIC